MSKEFKEYLAQEERLEKSKEDEYGANEIRNEMRDLWDLLDEDEKLEIYKRKLPPPSR